MDTPAPRMMALIEAGFTAEELRGISEGLAFAATLAEGYGTDVSVNIAVGKVQWTPEKRAAWARLLEGGDDA